MSAKAVLELRRVSKTFSQEDNGDRNPRLVLDTVDFSMTQGTIVGVLGKTGAGKTTLGKIIGGLLLPDSGGTMFNGQPVFGTRSVDSRRLRRDLRYVPQNPDASLSPRLRVGEALAEAERHSRLSGKELAAWRRKLLDLPVFRSEWLNRRMYDLSLGERKRVVNLRALLTYPRFIVFDEPFNGLDLKSKGAFMNNLESSARDHSMGVMIISHDTEALTQLAGRIMKLEDGHLNDWMISD
jgi:peptide/nickel transport system ATP-binding protein